MLGNDGTSNSIVLKKTYVGKLQFDQLQTALYFPVSMDTDCKQDNIAHI